MDGWRCAGSSTNAWPCRFYYAPEWPGEYEQTEWIRYWLTLFIVPPIACCLLVLLACAFVPSYKKYAGILVCLLLASFILYGAYQHYTYDGFVATHFKIIYSGFAVGLLAGFSISYIVFKNKH